VLRSYNTNVVILNKIYEMERVKVKERIPEEAVVKLLM